MHFSVDSTSAIEESLNINNNSTSNTDIELLRINFIQKEFINECKKNIKNSKNNAVQILFDPVPPTINPYTDPPNILQYGYLKKVVAMIPHLNFPGILLSCKKCNGNLAAKQFVNNPIARLCHGYHEDFYVLTYTYKCKDCSSTYCSSVLNLDEFTSSQYGIYFNKRFDTIGYLFKYILTTLDY